MGFAIRGGIARLVFVQKAFRIILRLLIAQQGRAQFRARRDLRHVQGSAQLLPDRIDIKRLIAEAHPAPAGVALPYLMDIALLVAEILDDIRDPVEVIGPFVRTLAIELHVAGIVGMPELRHQRAVEG